MESLTAFFTLAALVTQFLNQPRWSLGLFGAALLLAIWTFRLHVTESLNLNF